MVLKKNRGRKKTRLQKKVSRSAKKDLRYTKSIKNKKKNTLKKPKVIIPSILNPIKNLSSGIIKFIAAVINTIIKFINTVIKFISTVINTFIKFIDTAIRSILKVFQNLLKAPFVFINVFSSTLFFILKNIGLFGYSFIKNILNNILKFKEVIFGIFFGIISGGIGAILAVSYLELNSNSNKNDTEIYENYNRINDQLQLIEERLQKTEFKTEESKSALADLKTMQAEIVKSEEKYVNLEGNINNISIALEKVEEETNNLETNLSILSKDLKSNSRLILSSSKTELTNRLYLAQSLLDRLDSGIPYSPQLEALGKEGLDPALLRFAAGGAPTLKDLEARLSARAGEQLDADRTKRDNTWRENLRKEISKYVKIKPTNINEIKGVTGALLRAENSISRGNLAKAIEEISSVPINERGPLDAWLTEAKARQNADIAARNLLAKTTAALQQKN